MRQAVSAAVPNSPIPGAAAVQVLMVAGIFIATFLAYSPALNGGMLWDDAAHLTEQSLQSAHGLWEIWFKLGATQQYYPVLHSAFWLEHRLWGDAMVGYHILNVGLHATAACLFALVLARIRGSSVVLRPPGKSEWLAAAIFALHPVCVESVAWVSEQKNTLSLVFYLLSSLAYFRFERERRGWDYGLATGLFLLALLTKSVTATLPAALLLVAYWQRGTLEWRRDWMPLLPWLLMGIGAGVFTAWVESHFIISAQGAPYDLTYLQRGLLAGRIIWFYLGKLIWPANLIFIYPHWTVVTRFVWSLGTLAFAVAIGAAWAMRGRSRGPLVALLFFAGSLFPALGFVAVFPFQFSYVADHWQYLPAIGIIAAITFGAEAFWAGSAGILALKNGVTPLARALAALVLAGLFVLTWRQAHIYRSVEVLYQETLRKNPDCWLANNNLGLLRLDAGKVSEAIGYFKAALHTKPDCADAYNNLGNAYAKTSGHAAESIEAFEQALRYYPNMAEAHGNLGWALVNEPGRFDEGVSHLRRALQLRPELDRVHNSLGVALARTREGQAEAMAEFEAALQSDPDYTAARLNLGNALVATGRFPEAITQFETLLRIEPDNAQAYLNLGTALARAGKLPEAAAAFEHSLRLRPDSADVHNNLGNVLRMLGRESESIEHYRKALQLEPDSSEIHFNLALALRGTGNGDEAIAQYQAALRIARDDAEIWNSFGSFLFHLGRISDAAISYRESIHLQPEGALYHNNLGLALIEMHRFDEAIVSLRRAISLAPDNGDAHYNLGLALQGAGRGAEAAAEFKASGRNAPP